MVLADTSVWVDYVRNGSARMDTLLEKKLVVSHELIYLELSLWTPKNRTKFLYNYVSLETLQTQSISMVTTFVDSNELYGKGIGAVDATLLLSCVLNNAKLWTLDNKLNALAKKFLVAFP